MSTRTLARLIFSSSKYCRHRKCNSFKNCVELLPGFRDCHFDGSVSSNVRYVTSAVTEHIVRQSRGLVECSVLKWLKLTQFHLFTPLFDWKKQLCNGKTSLEAVNIYFCAFRNWKCLHHYRRPTMKIPELRWWLTEMSFNNPSQFPDMF